MTKQSFQLDPDAQAYTDDEIVGKVNAAAVAISRVDAIDGAALGSVDLDDIGEGSTNKHLTTTKDTKLTGIADGAEVNVGEEFTTSEQTKLTGIATGATIDQTGAEIKTAYEAEVGAFTDTKDTKLTGIEAGAEANIGEEFLTAEKTKLTGIAESATIDQTGAEIRDAIKALSDTTREIVLTDPQTGEFPIIAIQRDATGKVDVDYDDVAV